MRINRVVLFLIGITLLGTEPAFSMTTVNGWIEKVKSGLFEDTDATGDAGESKTRTYTESELKVLTSLSQREEELKRKEALHRQRAAELKKLSQQIEQKLDSFKKLTADFENKRKLRKEMDERDITTMVRYCETMDPERIAVFFNQMDRVTASQILMRMNPRKASAVWELLEPKVAVELIEMVTRFKQNRQEAR